MNHPTDLTFHDAFLALCALALCLCAHSLLCRLRDALYAACRRKRDQRRDTLRYEAECLNALNQRTEQMRRVSLMAGVVSPLRDLEAIVAQESASLERTTSGS